MFDGFYVWGGTITVEVASLCRVLFDGFLGDAMVLRELGRRGSDCLSLMLFPSSVIFRIIVEDRELRRILKGASHALVSFQSGHYTEMHGSSPRSIVLLLGLESSY